LLESVNEYEGAVVLISHDRRLIEGSADRLLLVADGRVRPFDGDMDEYRRVVLAADTGPALQRNERAPSRADARRDAAEQRERLKPLKLAMDRAEREVAALHGELEQIDAAMAEPALFVNDPRKGEALAKRRGQLARDVQEAEARWIEAAEAYERDAGAI
jgi:ATP-binding cassette subfamily F protein 3